MDYIVIYLLMVLKSMNSKQKILKLMQPLLCLDNVSKDFSADNMKKKIRLHRYVSDFSVDYDNIVVADILDIHKYLIKKQDIIK